MDENKKLVEATIERETLLHKHKDRLLVTGMGNLKYKATEYWATLATMSVSKLVEFGEFIREETGAALQAHDSLMSDVREYTYGDYGSRLHLALITSLIDDILGHHDRQPESSNKSENALDWSVDKLTSLIVFLRELADN